MTFFLPPSDYAQYTIKYKSRRKKIGHPFSNAGLNIFVMQTEA